MLIEYWLTNLFHAGLGDWSQMWVCLCLFPLLGHFQWIGRFVDETCNHKPITSDCNVRMGHHTWHAETHTKGWTSVASCFLPIVWFVDSGCPYADKVYLQLFFLRCTQPDSIVPCFRHWSMFETSPGCTTLAGHSMEGESLGFAMFP